jgi:hypothetical protein
MWGFFIFAMRTKGNACVGPMTHSIGDGSLERIKNFGPYMVKTLQSIGISSREDLLATDYKQIATALEAAGIRPHLNFFYSIEMGLQGRPWMAITPQEKRDIQRILQDP